MKTLYETLYEIVNKVDLYTCHKVYYLAINKLYSMDYQAF